MSAREDQVRDLIAQDAADWFVANREGLTASQRDSFAAWLKTSPQHVEEYLSLEVVGRCIRRAAETSRTFPDELLEGALEQKEPTRGFRRMLEALWIPSLRLQGAAVTLAAVLLVCIGSFVVWKLRPTEQVPVAAAVTLFQFKTHHGEQQVHQLPDGSVLHLNTDTAVTARYGDAERQVTLISGEAAFEVAHDAHRPFRIFAGPAEIVDLGTRFNVRMEETSTTVTLIEGRAAVGLYSATLVSQPRVEHLQPPGFVELKSDEQVRVSANDWPSRPVQVDARRSTAWLRRQIIFDHKPLGEVASEFNRYAAKPIEITTPRLRGVEISGTFATDNSAAFIAFLRSLEGVKVDVTATRILVSHE